MANLLKLLKIALSCEDGFFDGLRSISTLESKSVKFGPRKSLTAAEQMLTSLQSGIPRQVA